MTADVTRQRIRIAFVVTELTIGGAELMLWKLLSHLDRGRFEPFVFALSPRTDHILDLFRSIDVPFEVVGLEANVRAVGALRGLARRLREMQPHIVQGWLYHGNLAATVATFFAGAAPRVLWSIRGAPIPDEKWLSKAVIWLGARLASSPANIIYNSAVSATEHEQRLGYRSNKSVVIPNGFDTDSFRPSEAARAALRSTLGAVNGTLLVGLIARYHPVKDHDNFLRAAALVAATHPNVHYVLVGENVDATNEELRQLVSARGLKDRVHLLGFRDDMPFVSAALDVCVSSSSVEGFPNVIGEAMSCGVPCAVTEVGDSAALVGDTGKSVPMRDAHALAAAITELLELLPEERAALGRRARQRIVHNFSLASVVQRYESLYEEIHADARAGKA